ncbi:hybrid sensor histidine kinase/response regulator [Marinobacter caseinilyticus]|uniref:hybrid sensor histidine kinase/response regulator n=1 Tax=Marinobacter caseinilyticus TaxID=2692195 RepID=UPI001F40A45B|nr:hybrid sensor histidine kinase/response regulator [Marinobacter caseinilyticus]
MQQQERRFSLFWLIVANIVLAGLSLNASAVVGKDRCEDSVVVISPNVSSYDLASCVWYLEDPKNELTLEDIRDEERHPFTRHQGGMLNFGYTDSSYWTRFDLHSDNTHTGTDWILELTLPLVDQVELYVLRDGQLIDQRQAGYEDNWQQRDLALPNPTFKVQLSPDQETRIYLRVNTLNTFRLPLTLWNPDRYIEKVSVDEAVRGILLGSILAILAYNLFVAVSVRERSNVYYVLYLVSATVMIGTEQVHGIQLLDERPAFLHKQYLHYQILMSWFWGLLMARSLLETKEKSADLDQIIRLCLYSVVLTFVLSLFIPYHIAMEWIVLGSIMLCSIMIVVSYLAWTYYNPAARAYFFAWTAALSGFGLYALTVIGYLPLNVFTTYAPQIGLTAQIILFSFALADRIKQVQGEALSWSERALANLRRYQSLFDNAVEGVFQMSLHRRFITANPAMAALMGYSSNRELVDQQLDVLDTCFADERMRRWVVDQLEHKGILKGIEARYYNHQGEECWATISLHTVYDSDGAPLHLEGTCIDATERHQRQKIEKEREHERMEKDLARNAAQAKSQFLANMSHEIRTPLAAIIGYGEALLDRDLTPDEKRSSAETVVRSGRHLLDLVNDILDHSKIDANKLDVDVVSVNLPELLDEVRAFFVPRAREKGLGFSIVCDFPLPEKILTDPTRFRQIIINLCGNALKFTENGSITVTIRCERNAEQLIARVVDTGIGMKPEQIGRLFDPFAQGSAAIARQYGGTGLGLSISRRLAELLGGSIAVNSTYGEGSEFEVSIATGPLTAIHFLRDASELTQRRRQLPMVVAPRLQGRILCAEDNEVNRKLVSLLVARTGAELAHVSDGAEALDAAIHNRYDLILMDIQMPVMNGRDATAALREAGINTPVIALTANVMAEDIDDYRMAGCNEHVAKPIDKQRFYEVLARYLPEDNRGSPAEVRQFHGSVLVAEDNDDNRRQVERMLSRYGLTVTCVANGEAAVKAALSETHHLILMDRHMPGMDGVVATRMLRQTGFRRSIIAFTAGDQQEVDALKHAGCDGVLIKPIDQGHLEALLARVLATEPDAAPERIDLQPLTEQFCRSLRERQQRMNLALAAGDYPQLRSEAHQIKGTAGAMGYPEMTEQAGNLEACLRLAEPDIASVRAQLTLLTEQIEQALAPIATE